MIYGFDDCTLDVAAYELRRGGEMVSVEPQVFELLTLLISRHGQAVTRDEILDEVWKGRIVSEATLSSRIKAARQAIGDDGTNQRLIKTIHGRGFRFDGEVSEVSRPGPTVAEPAREARMRQTIKYCRASDGALLAFAISGEGPPLIKAGNWLTHLEYEWQSPVWGHWWRDLSSHYRLVRYDERGVGLSDWNVENLGFEAFVSDLEAVVEAVGLERFPLLGVSQGCAVSIAYAIRHPERVSALVLYGGYGAGWRARGDANEIARRQAMVELTRAGWGHDNPASRQVFTTLFVPDATSREMRWFNDLARITTSPENAARIQLACADIDIRSMLGEIRVPTLVIHQRDDAIIPMEAGRFLATNIPDARFVLLEGANHIILEEEASWPRFMAEVTEFLREHEIDDPATWSGSPKIARNQR